MSGRRSGPLEFSDRDGRVDIVQHRQYGAGRSGVSDRIATVDLHPRSQPDPRPSSARLASRVQSGRLLT
jgi:hypothetical protein